MTHDAATPDWQKDVREARKRRPKNVLFLCVANSVRSQMAEGLARSLAPPGVQVYSAGSHPSTIHRLAVRAMEEIGIGISGHRSKGLGDVPLDAIDLVVTLCAEEACPVFPRPVPRLHWGLPDPAGAGDDEAGLAKFRRVRDELERRLRELFRP